MGNAPTTFEDLLKKMEPLDLDLFNRLKTTKVVSAHAGDTLTLSHGAASNRYLITDFMCSHDVGASFELQDLGTGDTFIIGHTPVRVPGVPLMLWLPLKLRVEPHTRQGLEFNLCVRCPEPEAGYTVTIEGVGQKIAATAA